MAGVCNFIASTGLMYTTILPLAGMAAIFSLVTILIVYYIANMIDNPKLLTWAKTEIVQVVVSLSAVVIILAGMNLFCSIDAKSFAELVGYKNMSSQDMFNASIEYLNTTANYSHHAMALTRYYLSAYSILVYRSSFSCDISEFLGGIGCLFGSSGTGSSPLSNYSGEYGTLSMVFGSTILYFLTSVNMLFILLFTYKGLVLFFLPMAIIVRSLPYLRSFGAVLLAVCLSFYIIYPSVLVAFSIATHTFLESNKDPGHLAVVKEEKFESTSARSEFFYGSVLGAFGKSRYTNDDWLKDDFFPGGKDDFTGVLGVIGKAFIVSFVFPSLALAITIASIHYFARFYGEDIDLSRISQMV